MRKREGGEMEEGRWIDEQLEEEEEEKEEATLVY